MKKILILMLSIVLLTGCNTMNNKINEKLIKAIDEKCGQNDSCAISIKEITNFEWDKVAIFGIGGSNSEISKLLGVNYNDSVDLKSGIIFVLKDNIVCKQDYSYNPEIHDNNKIFIFLDKKPYDPNCFILTPDKSIIKGYRRKVDRLYYYMISNF